MNFQHAVPVAPGRRRAAGFVDKLRGQFRLAGAVGTVVDPQGATGQGHAFPRLRFLFELLGGTRFHRIAREIKMEHLRRRSGIVGEGIGGHVAMPPRGAANDDVNTQGKAPGDRLFEQPADFVSLDVGIDDQIAALDIGFRTL
jgi:hypothetical protein